MSLIYFDKAMYRKIRNLYPEVFFGSPEEVFKLNARKHKSRVLMPFIAVWRMPDFTINTGMYNDPALRRGSYGRAGLHNNTEFRGQPIASHGLPVTLQYQIDVYATKREVCDGITSELVLEMFENPYVNVVWENTDDKTEVQFNVSVDDSISDNTDIGDFSDSGRIYRLSLTLTIESALLARIGKGIETIERVEVDFKDMDSDETASKSVVTADS